MNKSGLVRTPTSDKIYVSQTLTYEKKIFNIVLFKFFSV